MSAPLDHFARAVSRLDAVLKEPRSMTQQEASIHCFEFAFELGWKSIQFALRTRGRDVATPRDALESAWRAGWIDDDEAWLDMLRDRNLTSHTYKESIAAEVASRLPRHCERLSQLASFLRSA